MIYLTSIAETADFSLSEYRMQKAQRTQKLKARQLSLACGGLLDYALMHQYGIREKDMIYAENEHGKPFFKEHEINFSLSDSGDYAACIVSDSIVGIDIEEIKEKDNILDIAARYFTLEEYIYLSSASDITDSFFKLWTRKESLLKALGCGIAGGLNKYCVLNNSVKTEQGIFYFKEFKAYGLRICAASKTEEKMKFITRSDFADMHK